MYTIVYKKGVDKQLEELPKKEYFRITKKILGLAENPRPYGCEKLKGNMDEYRIRSGNYRIIYTIADEILIVTIIKIAHRKSVYR
ncbi:MAG: type II toxin-antitoxin system RelE/ParE family toxin [Bacteroidia bacterium]|nr:type II toxin-antitoxin system RelE/ParE family toxin [Bacteroidia bacterium]